MGLLKQPQRDLTDTVHSYWSHCLIQNYALDPELGKPEFTRVMDPPLVNETSFSAANPPPYTLTELWPFAAIDGDPETCSVPGGLGLRIGNLGSWFGDRGEAAEESSGKEQSGGGGNAKKGRELSSEDESSKLVSTPSSGNELNDLNRKRRKVSGSRNEITNTKSEIQASSAANNKAAEQSSTLHEPPKQDYIHVRARRGQATDSHSLAERARREKISERMKILQELVPGCNKVIGKALVLDEIINYIQSLQRQVEFLSMKLEAVNSRMSMNPLIEGFHPEEPFHASGKIFGHQATREYAQGSQAEWLHMQVGGGFERPA